MRVAVLATLVFASVLCGIVLAQQSPRNDWAALQKHIDFDRYIDHSLGDAPLTAEERAWIYTLIDKSVHDSFRNDQREEERRLVLGLRVGLIALARTDSRQILVRGTPPQFCGATGNCALWVYMRQAGKARLILSEEGKDLIAGDSSYQGFTDLVVPFHDSASETSFSVYRWNNLEYKRIDCYSATSDPFHPGKAAVIRDCPAPPR